MVRDALADLPGGALVVVACSGGADSLALAAAAGFAAPPLGIRVAGVVVDHGLQPGSDEVARQAALALEALRLVPVEVRRAQVETSGGPEAAARRARYAALDGAAASLGAAAVLLGHTLDDQAETVLLGLARGSGARSLAGMAPCNGLLRRPFLTVSRATTRAACLAQGLTPWEDPHNVDPAFARVRVRLRVLPALEEQLGPGVSAALARTASLLRADADALEDWARRELVACQGGLPGLDVSRLAELPVAVRTRVLRMAALEEGCPPGGLTAGHVASVDRLVSAWRGQGAVDLPGARSVRRHCGRLLLGARHSHPS